MHRWSVTDFEPLVGTRCRLTLASGTTLAAEITEASALPAETSRPARLPRRAGFVVAFRAEAEETIGQQLFQVQLPQLGPSHSHNIVGSGIADSPSPADAHSGTNAEVPQYASPDDLVDLAPGALGATATGAAHNNRQPYLGLNFIVAMLGTYPSHS